MRLTTRGRYAVTAVLDLALHAGDGPVPLADVAERQGISQAYLEQLFRRLKQNGLVIGARGPGGGYRLARTLDETSVSDIISAVGEGVDATRCGGTGDCQDGEICLTHELWADLSQQIDLFLKRITFASLVERRDIRSIARRQDPKNLINAQIL
ncbi:MAG: Rrf2 family transcriptional regulator [Gammaproteobacteria bacterium]|nr:Rrf2 family transcriptional regulator [Gammaproteobacteria bacterium]